MRRVLVVGGPGSGKTTYAQRLAMQLEVPHQDLDRVAYEPPPENPEAPFWQWERVADELRRERAEVLAATEGWVADGLYAGWTEALRDAADRIVWLDPPARVTVWRVLRRAVADRGGDWDVRSALRVARGARDYRTRPLAGPEELRARDGANSSRTLAEFLRPVAGKVTRAVSGAGR
jgi:adenylate kinase family enzyme